jgi:hypothetical protein
MAFPGPALHRSKGSGTLVAPDPQRTILEPENASVHRSGDKLRGSLASLRALLSATERERDSAWRPAQE